MAGPRRLFPDCIQALQNLIGQFYSGASTHRYNWQSTSKFLLGKRVQRAKPDTFTTNRGSTCYLNIEIEAERVPIRILHFTIAVRWRLRNLTSQQAAVLQLFAGVDDYSDSCEGGFETVANFSDIFTSIIPGINLHLYMLPTSFTLSFISINVTRRPLVNHSTHANYLLASTKRLASQADEYQTIPQHILMKRRIMYSSFSGISLDRIDKRIPRTVQ